MARVVLALALLAVALPALAALTTSCSSSDDCCIPGATASCACAGGLAGVQTCTSEGTFGACDCSAPDMGTPPTDAGPGDDATIDAAADSETSPDAAADVGTDAPSSDMGRDASAGCFADPDCDDGNECTLDQCMMRACRYQNVEGLACDDDTGVCFSATCMPCGGVGQICCTAAGHVECTDTHSFCLAMPGSGTMATCTACGHDGERCCTGDNCDDGLACDSSGFAVCRACGGHFELCCTTGTTCTDTYDECALGSPRRCDCGHRGLLCCAGTTGCDVGTTCREESAGSTVYRCM